MDLRDFPNGAAAFVDASIFTYYLTGEDELARNCRTFFERTIRGEPVTSQPITGQPAHPSLIWKVNDVSDDYFRLKNLRRQAAYSRHTAED